jgi:hypothetical protein
MIVLITSMITAEAYSQIESYVRINKGGSTEADINVYGEKKISPKFNLIYFALIEKTWAEGLVGISYSPKDWISVDLRIGIEQNPALYRIAGGIWTGKGNNSLLILWEKGKGNDNYWYRITPLHKFSERFSLGVRAWRFHGVGPIGIYTFPKVGVSLFLLPTRDFEFNTNRLITGLLIKI